MALTFSNTRYQDTALDPCTGAVCHQEMREQTVTWRATRQAFSLYPLLPDDLMR